MKKLIIVFITITFLLTACFNNNAKPLTEEAIETFKVNEATNAPSTSEPISNNISELSLDDKFSSIGFSLVSGVYTRKVLQEDMEVIEMFTLDKTNFIRIASNELEQEVYAYNYVSDNFTYLYYFDDDLISKTIFNIDTGAILEDRDGYSDVLKIASEELKTYFLELLSNANLSINDIDQQ